MSELILKQNGYWTINSDICLNLKETLAIILPDLSPLELLVLVVFKRLFLAQ